MVLIKEYSFNLKTKNFLIQKKSSLRRIKNAEVIQIK